MPVIGRLDDQVEAVLINPLRRPTTTPPDAGAHDESPSPSDEDVAAEPPDEASPAGRARREAALPVWML